MSDEENNIFRIQYQKVLAELDVLYRGVYDPSDAEHTAALCLIAQSSLIPKQTEAEFRARAFKREIDFAKAEAYSNLKDKKNSDGKKLSEAALAQLINKDQKVHELYQEHNKAEKEAKELANILLLLRDAHITFRSLSKKEN